MRTDAVRNRARILDVARQLVAEHGAAVTMDDLAARSGVAVGTLYRHFPTKDDLIAAVLDASLARLADLAESALGRVEDGGSPWAELTGFWSAIAEGPQAGRATRLAAASLGVRLRDGGVVPTGSGEADRALTALNALLRASQHAGQMRDDVTVADLFLLLAQAPEHDEAASRSRYFELVADGLRP